MIGLNELLLRSCNQIGRCRGILAVVASHGVDLFCGSGGSLRAKRLLGSELCERLALGRHLGRRAAGLLGPAIDVQQDLDFTFDLRHPEQVRRGHTMAKIRRILDIDAARFSTSATLSTNIPSSTEFPLPRN